MYICVYECMRVCMYVCMYVRMNACVYVCLSVCLSVYEICKNNDRYRPPLEGLQLKVSQQTSGDERYSSSDDPNFSRRNYERYCGLKTKSILLPCITNLLCQNGKNRRMGGSIADRRRIHLI